MIASTRNWLKKHRTKIAVGAGVFGTAYLAGQYVIGKITEARQRMSDDRISRENLRRRFEQNQEDCTYTVLALLPTATENITKAMPVEQILQELQQRKSDKLARSAASSEIAHSDVPSGTDEDGRSLGGGSSSFIRASQIAEDTAVTAEGSEPSPAPAQALIGSGKSKVQLWNELKISSITRAFTLIYTLALLTLFTRIQLNLLGRRTYLSSVISLAAPLPESSQISLENHDDDSLEQEYGSDFETNRKFLTFSWWLLHRGWKDLQAKVEAAVKEVFGSLNPRDSLSFQTLSKLTLEVRELVEGVTEEERRTQQWLSYLLPTVSEEEFVLRESGIAASSPSSPSSGPPEPTDNSTVINSSLRRLLEESADIIESPTFTHVLTLALDAAYSLLIDTKLAVQAFKMPTPFNPSHASFVETSTTASNVPMDGLSATSSSSQPRIQEIGNDEEAEAILDPRQRKSKLATILAVFTRQAHAIGSGGNMGAMMNSANDLGAFQQQTSSSSWIRDANDYLASIEMIRDLEGFAAVVYSSNFEYENIDNDETPTANGSNRAPSHPASATNERDALAVEDSMVHVHSIDAEPELQAEDSSSFQRAWDNAHATGDDRD